MGVWGVRTISGGVKAMTDIDKVYDRFRNLLDIMKMNQLETVTARYTEHDLKEIIYLLGELKAIREGNL